MLAKYTEVLKNLLDNEQTKPLIDKALSTYPLYTTDKAYDLIPTRDELNKRLLNNYKYREIGFETVGRFIDELEIAMCEIMPKYNERFKTVVTMAELPNPFDNVDVIETYDEERTNKTVGTGSSDTQTTGTNKTDTTGTSSQESTVNNTGTENGKSVHSDTPQNQLSITGKDIDSVDYADSAQWDGKSSTDKSTSSGTSSESGTADSESSSNTESSAESETTENGTTKHTYTKKGNQGVNTYAHDMNEFRTSIIDVVNEIINDIRIRELFMLVY